MSTAQANTQNCFPFPHTENVSAAAHGRAVSSIKHRAGLQVQTASQSDASLRKSPRSLYPPGPVKRNPLSWFSCSSQSLSLSCWHFFPKSNGTQNLPSWSHHLHSHSTAPRVLPNMPAGKEVSSSGWASVFGEERAWTHGMLLIPGPGLSRTYEAGTAASTKWTSLVLSLRVGFSVQFTSVSLRITKNKIHFLQNWQLKNTVLNCGGFY